MSFEYLYVFKAECYECGTVGKASVPYDPNIEQDYDLSDAREKLIENGWEVKIFPEHGKADEYALCPDCVGPDD